MERPSLAEAIAEMQNRFLRSAGAQATLPISGMACCELQCCNVTYVSDNCNRARGRGLSCSHSRRA